MTPLARGIAVGLAVSAVLWALLIVASWRLAEWITR